MLTRIKFTGFEPFIHPIDLQLGRVNLFIGVNGSGKSRLLDAIGVFTAALCERDGGYVPQEHRGVRPGGYEQGRTEATFWWSDGETALHKVYLDGLLSFGRQDWHHTRRGKAAAQLALSAWVDGYQVYDLREEHLRAPAPNTQAVKPGKYGQALAAVFKDTLHSARMPFGVDALVRLLPGISGLHYDQDRDGISIAATSRDLQGHTVVIPARELGAGVLLATGMWALATGRLASEFLAIDNFAHHLHPELEAGLTRLICWAASASGSRKQLLLATHQSGVMDGLDLRSEQVRLFLVDDHPQGGKRVRPVSIQDARQFAGLNIPASRPPQPTLDGPDGWGERDEEWVV